MHGETRYSVRLELSINTLRSLVLLPEADYFMSSQSVRRKEIISTYQIHPPCLFVRRPQAKISHKAFELGGVSYQSCYFHNASNDVSRTNLRSMCSRHTHTPQASIALDLVPDNSHNTMVRIVRELLHSKEQIIILSTVS